MKIIVLGFQLVMEISTTLVTFQKMPLTTSMMHWLSDVLNYVLMVTGQQCVKTYGHKKILL